jgi:hypothetical protein
MGFKSNTSGSNNEEPSNLDFARLNAGFMGKLFGTGKNGPVNIAGICIISGILVGLVITGIATYSKSPEPYAIWQYVSPLITGALGFIFGKGGDD